METLEFVIYPDGRITEAVTGVSGQSCAELTAAIEAELGVVVAQAPTADYYAQSNLQTSDWQVQTEVVHSQW
ncbi:MAG: DUF2997 domain-containing protein [Nodosilinea sp.]